MLHLLHLADIHFGMENYGRLDPATGLNRRLLDFTRSVHTAIDYALDHDVHLAIFAGDIYKHRDPDPSWQRAFAELRAAPRRGRGARGRPGRQPTISRIPLARPTPWKSSIPSDCPA